MNTIIHRYHWDAPRDHGCPFRVYSHGLNERMPPGIVTYLNENDWLLVFFNSAVAVELETGLARLPANSLVFWAPTDTYRYGNPNEEWLHSWIHVTGTAVEDILARAGIRRLTPLLVEQPLLVEDYLGRIFAELSSHAEPNDLILRNLFENWLLEMSRASSSGEVAAVPEAIKRLKRHLDMHLTEKISLQEMSRIAHLSVSHMCAEFTRAYATSPGKYLLERRMVTAKYLLANRTMTVTEVAQEMGYPDIYQFSRMFKRIVGVSPRHYRR